MQMKEWHPNLDVRGDASKYQHALQETLERNNGTAMESVEQVMYEAATYPGVRTEVPKLSKPWHSEELQDLIHERRFCSSAPGRSEV